MNTAFSKWLIEQMKERRWSQADLSKESKLTRQAIANYVNGRIPSDEAIEMLARAFELPKNVVLLAAEIVEPDPELDEELQQIMYEIKKLNDDDRREVLAYIRMKNNLRKKK